MVRALKPASRSHNEASGAPRPKLNAQPALARHSINRVRREFVTGATLPLAEKIVDLTLRVRNCLTRSVRSAVPISPAGVICAVESDRPAMATTAFRRRDRLRPGLLLYRRGGRSELRERRRLRRVGRFENPALPGEKSQR